MVTVIRYGVEDPDKRAHIDGACVEANRLPETHAESTSPSGLFRLDVWKYTQRVPYYWDYSRGLVTQVRDGRTITAIRRNYGHFWHSWVNHANGHEYLLCGEDYQGYTVIDLCHEVERVYLPEGAAGGAGFCWTAALPSPDGRTVAVEGCYWGAPYELVFFDFTQPEERPLPDLRLRDEREWDHRRKHRHVEVGHVIASEQHAGLPARPPKRLDPDAEKRIQCARVFDRQRIGERPLELERKPLQQREARGQSRKPERNPDAANEAHRQSFLRLALSSLRPSSFTP